MNKHTMGWPAGQRHVLPHGDLQSPPLDIAGAILERLAKPRKDAASRPILPSATVVLTPDGAPIRSVLTGRRVMVTGFYNSRKAGRALPYEGMNELALLKRSEVDTQVVDYRSQPFRFEFVLDGAKRIYIADCVRLLEDRSIEVIEVKGDPRQLQAPAYAEKLDAVRDACSKLDWRFRVLTRKQLFEPKVSYANIDQIQSRRMVRFDQSQAYRAVDFLDQRGGKTTLGSLAETLGKGPLGIAIAQAMMVSRLIEIDLNVPLSAESQVQLVAQRPVLGRAAR